MIKISYCGNTYEKNKESPNYCVVSTKNVFTLMTT